MKQNYESRSSHICMAKGIVFS